MARQLCLLLLAVLLLTACQCASAGDQLQQHQQQQQHRRRQQQQQQQQRPGQPQQQQAPVQEQQQQQQRQGQQAPAEQTGLLEQAAAVAADSRKAATKEEQQAPLEQAGELVQKLLAAAKRRSKARGKAVGLATAAAQAWRPCRFLHPLSLIQGLVQRACNDSRNAGAVEAHASMRAWLQEYFAAGGPRRDYARRGGAAADGAGAVWAEPYDANAPPALLPESRADAHTWEVAGDGSCVRSARALSAVRAAAPRRRFLVMAPVGRDLTEVKKCEGWRWLIVEGLGATGSSSAGSKILLLFCCLHYECVHAWRLPPTLRRWLAQPALATFDFIAIHYGNQTQLDCAFCERVFYFTGPKWRLVWQVTQTREWQEEIAPRYDAVMLGDDDLQMTTCKINRCAY